MFQIAVPPSYEMVGAHVSRNDLSTDQQLGVPFGADGILVQAITQNVRIRLDGVAATATTGFQIRAGDPAVFIPLKPNSIVHVIQETATAVLQVQPVRLATSY